MVLDKKLDSMSSSQGEMHLSPNFPQTDQEQPSQKKKKPIKKIVLFCSVIVFFVVLAILSLVFTGKVWFSPGQVIAKKPLIKIAVNPWTAAELNANIAKIILQEKMGFPVKLVPVDENSQWQALAKGEIHTSLEVWPSGHKKDIQKYIITEKSVTNGGDLGPIGKIGWYIPSYLKDEHPELATWQGFKDPKNVALFSSVPGGKGQFFTGDPTWVQYDSQIIKNLGLNFEVKILGSEDALIKAVDEAYNKKKPIVFYFWTPHWAESIYNLTPVALPPYTDACYADLKNGVNCDYPADHLFKVFWSKFTTYAPQAYHVLKNFNYTSQDQIGMLAAVQKNKQSVESVARFWVNNNESVWKPWLQ